MHIGAPVIVERVLYFFVFISSVVSSGTGRNVMIIYHNNYSCARVVPLELHGGNNYGGNSVIALLYEDILDTHIVQHTIMTVTTSISHQYTMFFKLLFFYTLHTRYD